MKSPLKNKPAITPRPVTWDKTKTLIPCQCARCQLNQTLNPQAVVHIPDKPALENG